MGLLSMLPALAATIATGGAASPLLAGAAGAAGGALGGGGLKGALGGALSGGLGGSGSTLGQIGAGVGQGLLQGGGQQSQPPSLQQQLPNQQFSVANPTPAGGLADRFGGQGSFSGGGQLGLPTQASVGQSFLNQQGPPQGGGLLSMLQQMGLLQNGGVFGQGRGF